MNTEKSTRNEALRFVISAFLAGAVFPVIATILEMLNHGYPLQFSSILETQLDVPLLWLIDIIPIALAVFAAIAIRREGGILSTRKQLHGKIIELEQAQSTFETRLHSETNSLQHRLGQIKIVSEVARSITLAQELETLLPEIANRVSNQFGFYHTGIFLLNETREFAVLQASNSDGGKRMLARNHRLGLDFNSIVGYTATLGEPRIALDVGADSVYFNNPDLPNTRSEMALPLKIANRVIGVLDVQSTEKNAFASDDIEILTILADQVAVALENARLLSQTNQALSESQTTFEKYIRQEWNKFSKQAQHPGFVYDGKQILPLTNQLKRERMRNHSHTGSLTLNKTTSNITVPIRLRGQTIGVLDIRPKRDNREWTQNELALLEAAAERAALALENARLVENAQRRASRERHIGEIASRISSVTDRDLILQTAVEELGRKISNTEITIEIESNISQG